MSFVNLRVPKSYKSTRLDLAMFLYRQGATPTLETLSTLLGPLRVELDYDAEGLLKSVRVEEVVDRADGRA